MILVGFLILCYKRLIEFRRSIWQYSGSLIPLFQSTPIRTPIYRGPRSRLQEDSTTFSFPPSSPSLPTPPPTDPSTPQPLPTSPSQDGTDQETSSAMAQDQVPSTSQPTAPTGSPQEKSTGQDSADTKEGSSYEVSMDSTSKVITFKTQATVHD